MANEEIVKVLNLFIDTFRIELNKLNENEKGFFTGSINLNAPCQIDIFLLDGIVNFQLLLISHDPASKDKEIIIGGPFKSNKFLETVEDFINKDEKWKRILPKESPMKRIDGGEVTYGSIMLGRLGNHFKDMHNIIFAEIKNDELYQVAIMFADVAAYFLFNNIEDFDYTKFIESKVAIAKQFTNAQANSKQIIATIPPPKEGSKGGSFVLSSSNIQTNVQGYGVMFYPPIWIDKWPEQKLSERVFKQPVFRKTAFHENFNGKKLIFTTDGFLGLECGSKDEAMKVFNAFFAVGHLFGLSFFAVNEDDVADITIDANKSEIGRITMQGYSERMQLMHPFEPLDANKRFNVVKQDALKPIVEITSKLINNPLIVSQLTFLLEGYTYLANSEYSQSFIMDWLIMEKFFASKWDALRETKKIAGSRKDDFKDNDKWDSYHKLELLNLVGEIDDKTYLTLRDFNKKRNSLVHKGAQISQEDAKTLYKLVFNTVKSSIGL